VALNERAMKVTLKRTRPALTKRDGVAEAFVQEELGDSALVVNKKLFRDNTNPINQILRAMDNVYAYHKKNTLPWVDAGPRLLPNARYMDYTHDMRGLIASVDSLLKQHMPNYSDYVNLDIAWRMKQDALNQKVKPSSYVMPDASDYPLREDFESAVSVKLRFETLPDAPDCVFDEDKAEMEELKKQIEVTATNAVVEKMLVPLKHLASKLDIPIGDKGHIFRDSALENIQEGIDLARKLTITPSDELTAITDELEKTLYAASAKTEWLRESPINRKTTAEKMKEIADKMGGLLVRS
jgi:hypothetical protein